MVSSSCLVSWKNCQKLAGFFPHLGKSFPFSSDVLKIFLAREKVFLKFEFQYMLHPKNPENPCDIAPLKAFTR